MALAPQEEWVNLSHLLIFHGRRCCDAKKPKCASCTNVHAVRGAAPLTEIAMMRVAQCRYDLRFCTCDAAPQSNSLPERRLIICRFNAPAALLRRRERSRTCLHLFLRGTPAARLFIGAATSDIAVKSLLQRFWNEAGAYGSRLLVVT